MTRSREGVAALYVVIMLIVPLVGFPFVQPAAMVASAETIEGGNAPSADMFESALNAPSSAVIEYNTASDLTLSYDLTGVSASTYTITLFDSDQNQIDSASSGSDADTLTLTIAANEVTSSQTLDAELTADGMQYGGDSIDVTAVDLSGSPSVDVTSETVTAAGDTPLTVGYDAEGAIGGGDTLRMELWDPNSNTKLDTVTGLESDLRGAANPLWPAGDYDGGGQVEVRLIKNAGNQLASDTAQISEGAFITSSSVEHHTGSQPTMNQVAINEQSINMGNQGSLIFFYLHTAGNTQQRDIGTVGADESTQLWVNFTVENYNPEIMMGAADVAEWQTSPSQTTTGTNLSILLNTTSVQRHYDWQNPVPFDPSQWPDRAEMATHGVDAGAELMVGDMPDSGPAADLHGARLNTDAQVYTVPTVNNESLEFNVAAPHCTVDASGGGCDDEPANVNDDGFYEAVVPSSFVQNAWGEVSASDLTGTYTSGGTTETLSLTVSEQPDGDLFIRAENIHYSDGTIALEPSSEDSSSSSGGGSSGSSTTATPTPTPTATPTPTPEPTVTPEPTETPEPTATPVPTETVATATDTPAPDPTTTEGTGPGFGAVGALTAIVLGIALLARRP